MNNRDWITYAAILVLSAAMLFMCAWVMSGIGLMAGAQVQ